MFVQAVQQVPGRALPGLTPPLGCAGVYHGRWIGLISLGDQVLVATLKVGELFWAEGALSSLLGRSSARTLSPP